MNSALLPSGLFDLLPPHSVQESAAARRLVHHFDMCGYALATPTLVEYEDTLLSDQDELMRNACFRVMDPLSQRMMTIRADMTMQVARIAGTLMQQKPRPLRLCYAGQTLRTKAEGLRSSRQFRQVGIELFGANSTAAEVEVIQTAAMGLEALGLSNLSVDLNMGCMLEVLAKNLSGKDRSELIAAVSRKDFQAIDSFNLPHVSALIRAAGPADEALTALNAMELPDALTASLTQLKETVTLLGARLGERLTITIDPLELRGFGYYKGISFSLFLKDQQIEVGRGGRYTTQYGETATGFTLYTEDLLPAMPEHAHPDSVLLAASTTESDAHALREKGYRTAYTMTDNLSEEAKALGYAHIYDDNQLKDLS